VNYIEIASEKTPSTNQVEESHFTCEKCPSVSGDAILYQCKTKEQHTCHAMPCQGQQQTKTVVRGIAQSDWKDRKELSLLSCRVEILLGNIAAFGMHVCHRSAKKKKKNMYQP
jgi:hypothetical protein